MSFGVVRGSVVFFIGFVFNGFFVVFVKFVCVVVLFVRICVVKIFEECNDEECVFIKEV